MDCWPDMLPPMFSRSIAMPAVCCRMTHGIARRGNALQLIEREGLPRAGLLGVDDRALTRDRHRFLHRGDAELLADVGAEADRHLDAFLNDRLEPGELELDVIGPDLQPRELEGSRLRRRGRLRLQQDRSRQSDRDARQHRAGLVGDLSENLARLGLGGRRGDAEHQREAANNAVERNLIISPPETLRKTLLEHVGCHAPLWDEPRAGTRLFVNSVKECEPSRVTNFIPGKWDPVTAKPPFN